MTIGDRIRYCRTRLFMTQAQLAESTGIHPVSIRKYETNKTIPQPEQIRRIADVLCVSYTAIAGLDYANLDIKEQGDFVGFIMQLQKKGLVSFTGTRDSQNKLYLEDTFRIKINPQIAQYLTIFIKNRSTTVNANGDQLEIQLPERVTHNLIVWEAATNIYNNAINSYTEPYPDDVKEGLRMIADNVAKIEIEAQSNPAFVWLPNEFRNSNEMASKGTTANKSTEKTSQDSPIAQLLKGIFSTNH